MLAAAQATGYAYLFKRQGALTSNSGRLVLIIITLTAGTTLLMYMGELITKRGIGNGISLLIFASILVSAPAGITAWYNGGPMEKLFFPLIALGIIVAVVFMQEGQRRIPIQYAKRMIGRKMTTGESTYLPLRVNMAGVIPIIFAAALLALPQTLGSFAPEHADLHQPRTSRRRRGRTSRVEAALIIVFTFFYTAVQFNPVDQADNLRKHGGYIPGIRPGPADRAVPRPRADPADAAGLDLPGGGRGPAEHLHQVRRLLAGHLARPRRHLGADRRRRRARHDAPDGVADDDALLRRLPQVVADILLLGPQGAGKGTQGRLIAAEHGIPHVATGDMLRAAIYADTELGRQVKPIYDAGQLVPDDLMIALIRERLGEENAREGFVLDGFPRTMPQAEALEEMLREIGRDLDVVFEFQLADEVGRRADAQARGRGGPQPTTRPRRSTSGCGSTTRETEPLIEYYRTRGNLVGIHADRPVQEVFREIQQALEQVAVR